MNLLVFAHKPPPNHGQSYMVEAMLHSLEQEDRQDHSVRSGKDCLPTAKTFEARGRIQLFHVDARFSDEPGQIGRFRLRKVIRLLWYCLQAVVLRFKCGADVLYYVPAPAKRVAIYRDWIVMLCCRPFFRKVVFHWHASGIGQWLETGARRWESNLTRFLLGKPDLSIVLGSATQKDATAVESRSIRIVPNGIPDPCEHFADHLQHDRLTRLEARREALEGVRSEKRSGVRTPASFRVLFVGLCTREKGLFDVVEAVVQLNQRLAAANTPLVIQLIVAGTFAKKEERIEFDQAAALANSSSRPLSSESSSASSDARMALVSYRGFVTGEQKAALFRECDCLCFPSFYQAESFPLVILEAMAFGMEVVSTRWRNIPEILPEDYCGLVEPRSPKALLGTLERCLTSDGGYALRQRYLQCLTLPRHVSALRAALLELDQSPTVRPLTAAPAP